MLMMGQKKTLKPVVKKSSLGKLSKNVNEEKDSPKRILDGNHYVLHENIPMV